MPKAKETTKKKVRKTTKRKPKYELRVRVNDVDFTSTGNTVLEALGKFVDSADFPYGAKTQSVFTVSKGKESGVLSVPAIRTRRLFLQFPEKDSVLELFANTLKRRITM